MSGVGLNGKTKWTVARTSESVGSTAENDACKRLEEVEVPNVGVLLYVRQRGNQVNDDAKRRKKKKQNGQLPRAFLASSNY